MSVSTTLSVVVSVTVRVSVNVFMVGAGGIEECVHDDTKLFGSQPAWAIFNTQYSLPKDSGGTSYGANV